MSTTRRGFTIANDKCSISFLPGPDSVRVRASLETDEGEFFAAQIELSEGEIEDFMTDMRRVQRDSRLLAPPGSPRAIGEGVEASEHPTLPGLEGTDEERPATPAATQAAIGEVKEAAERSKRRTAGSPA